ncbi:hypothetical protein AOLI_G00286110 [Acnodon oligacanthus]
MTSSPPTGLDKESVQLGESMEEKGGRKELAVLTLSASFQCLGIILNSALHKTATSFGEDSASGTCLTGSLSSKDSQGVFHCGMPDVYGRAHLSLPMNICDPEKCSSNLLTQTE